MFDNFHIIKKFDFVPEQSYKGVIQSFIHLSSFRENNVLIE